MLSEKHIKELLFTASGYDGRKPPSQAQTDAWFEGAKRGNWTFDEARSAVHEHYSRSTDWIMPAHVSAIVRAARAERIDRDADQRERSRAAGVDAAGRARVAEIVAQLAAKLGMPTDPDHDEARRLIECSWCKAGIGERCRNPRTGKPLRQAAGHEARIEALQRLRAHKPPSRLDA